MYTYVVHHKDANIPENILASHESELNWWKHDSRYEFVLPLLRGDNSPMTEDEIKILKIHAEKTIKSFRDEAGPIYTEASSSKVFTEYTQSLLD